MSSLRGYDSATQGFPNDPIFTQLARYSRTIPGVLIHDEYGIDASYGHLLNDIINLRQNLREKLPCDFFNGDGLLKPETGAIATITVSTYYFIVAFFAIAALGGKCAPLPSGVLPEEALYFLNKINAGYILSEPNTAERATASKRHAQDVAGQELHTFQIQAGTSAPSSTPEMEIDEDMKLPPTDPCLIIFTSGTTGKPKGVVLPRQRFYFRDQLDLHDLYLAYRVVHWIGGSVPVIARVLQGGRIHSMKRPTRGLAVEMWETFKRGRITVVSLPPALYKALQEHYVSHIRYLPKEEHDLYLAGVTNFRVVMNSGSALDPSTAQFWRELANLPIRNAYAATELGGAAIMTPLGCQYIDGCIGKPVPGVSVKLSHGNYGEILVKSPRMFTHYIGDDEITNKAFDEDGYYKTGDIGRLIDHQYFFEGRDSTDWIRFKHFKISIIEVEQHLMKLPYISEAYVLSVPDYECRGLAAALIRLNNSRERQEGNSEIDLRKVREDLFSTLELYKLPALMRILTDEDEVPFTPSGKPLKSKMLERYFEISGYCSRDYVAPGVEFWGARGDLGVKRRAWDWEGQE